jgi:hypothetical protein
MTTASTPTAPRAASSLTTTSRALTADECRSWLTTHGEARLGYLSGRGRRNVIVAYAVTGDTIVVRVPHYNEITQCVPDRQVTLDVTTRAGDTVEQVTVTGRASIRKRTPATVLNLLPDEHWPTDLSNVVVSVPLDQVDGRVVGVPGGTEASAAR